MNDDAHLRVLGLLEGVRESGRSALLEGEVYQVLGASGIAVPRFAVVPVDADERGVRAALAGLTGGPVVVKIQSPDILHKTEAGGIAFVDGDPGAVVRAVSDVVARVRRSTPEARLAGVLIVERVAYRANLPGAEILLSLRQDPAFGPVVVVGLGGLLTEWYGRLAPGRTTWAIGAHDPRLASATPPDPGALGPAFELLMQPSRLHREAPVEPAALWGAVRAVAGLARAFGNDATGPVVLEELEINPLAAHKGGVVALDGVARLGTEREVVRRRRLDKIHQLLSPRSVAVIGASARAANSGRVILDNLRTAPGVDHERVYSVHPTEARIAGVACVANVAALPEKVDLAVVAVPAEAARDAIADLVEHDRAHAIILIPGGFAETGDRALADAIIASLERSRGRADGGPVLVGANCLGIVSKHRYNTFFLPQHKLPFHDAPGDNLVAISQSGAYLVTLGSNLDGVLFPKASISFGNQMDLTAADLLEHWLDDPGVEVITCYIEGFQPLDGARFVDLVRAHREQGRRVLVFKAGRTEHGAQAAASHTASLAGDYPVARDLLVDAGAVVCETLDELEDLTKTFAMLYARAPVGRRVGVLSNAGFECSAAMDALHDLEPAQLSVETRRALEAALPSMGHADNPVDATPMATTEQLVRAVEAVLADPGVDVVVVSAVPVTPALNVLEPDPGRHAEDVYAEGSLARELVRVIAASGKPVVAAIDSGALYDACVGLLQQAGVPTFRRIDRATRALSRYCTARLD